MELNLLGEMSDLNVGIARLTSHNIQTYKTQGSFFFPTFFFFLFYFIFSFLKHKKFELIHTTAQKSSTPPIRKLPSNNKSKEKKEAPLTCLYTYFFSDAQQPAHCCPFIIREKLLSCDVPFEFKS